MSKKKKIKALEESVDWYKSQYEYWLGKNNPTATIINGVKEGLDSMIQKDISFNLTEDLGLPTGLPNEYTVVEPVPYTAPVFGCSECGFSYADCECNDNKCDCGNCMHSELKVVCVDCGNEWV